MCRLGIGTARPALSKPLAPVSRSHGARPARKYATLDGRNRLSMFWAPTGGISLPTQATSRENTCYLLYIAIRCKILTSIDDSSALLSKAGFIRQSGSGIFHLLPLGLRVQEKIEHLVDYYMQGLGASKVSLSSITSEALWEKSGRFTSGENPEMYRLAGQKGTTGHLLAPTHEEEITEIAKSVLKSYRDLPLRLYQISRKYRNELRPRGGLLRAREFVMKDLYTFDVDEASCLETYDAVRDAYAAFFGALKIPYLTGAALSGGMGGTTSHEYHYASPAGEDTLLACESPSCSYAINEEVLRPSAGTALDPVDRPTTCPLCGTGALKPVQAVELGHTFVLGTRYSEPLGVGVAVPSWDAEAHQPGRASRGETPSDASVPVHMGCYGIGVSRLIGAAASMLADTTGLNWPRRIAPFEVVVMARDGLEAEALRVHDVIAGVEGRVATKVDVLLDDRPERLSWKLSDADLIGYPVIVVLGKAWDDQQRCEVQCRQLKGLRQNVAVEDLPQFVESLLNQL